MDGQRFLAVFFAVFLAGALLLADFRAVDFFAARFLAGDFLAVFLAVARLAVFLAGDLLAVFLAVDFLAVFLAGDLLAVFLAVARLAVFLAGDLLAVFLAVARLAVDFLADFLAGDLLAAFLAVDFFADFLAVFLAVAFLADFLAAADFLRVEAEAVALADDFLAGLAAATTATLGNALAPDTTAFSSAPARNFGTDVFFACTLSPVRGLRTMRAGRTAFSKAPNPVMATFSPRATSRAMVSITASRASEAALRLPSKWAASVSMNWDLFTGFPFVNAVEPAPDFQAR